jgi:hypothetical protein
MNQVWINTTTDLTCTFHTESGRLWRIGLSVYYGHSTDSFLVEWGQISVAKKIKTDE